MRKPELQWHVEYRACNGCARRLASFRRKKDADKCRAEYADENVNRPCRCGEWNRPVCGLGIFGKTPQQKQANIYILKGSL